MPVRFPIGRSGNEILNAAAPALPRVSRPSDALRFYGLRVALVTEMIGPEFKTEDAALDCYRGLVDDVREGTRFTPPVEDGYYRLSVRFRRGPGRPSKRAAASRELDIFYQLAVSYFKVLDGRNAPADTTLTVYSDRRARRRRKSAFSADDLAAIANTPLTSSRKQLPLDFGLFERPDPEKPGFFIADE